MDHFHFEPNFDHAAFFNVSAAFVKFLIRARWRSHRYFLTADELRRWGLSDIDSDHLSESELLRAAAEYLGLLNSEYLPRCSSGGVRLTDESTHVGRLIRNLAFVVQGNYAGGPLHNDALLRATEAAGGGVDWEELADWSLLPVLREDLDRLKDTLKHRDANAELHTPGRMFSLVPKDGGRFYVKAGQKDALMLRPLVGLSYLHALLSAPGRPINAMKLTGKIPQTIVVESGADSAGPRTDEPGLEALEKRLVEIEGELAAARDRHDPAKAERLAEEKDQIINELRNSRGLGNIFRELASESRRAADRVQKALRRAIADISEYDQDLGRHIQDSTTTGITNCVYRPMPGVSRNLA